MSTENQAKFASSLPLNRSRVDKEKGILRDVAIMQVGTAHGEIGGKPMAAEVTLESLQALYAIIANEPKKAHVLHGEDHAPTNPIGIFSGFYIDMKSEPITLRAAQFEAFKAFRENSKLEYETMFELAEVAPMDMAISADFRLSLIERDGLAPIAMPTAVTSFDFVNEGAATNGLFSKKTLDSTPEPSKELVSLVETESQSQSQEAKLSTTVTSTPNPLNSMRAVFAKFSDNPKALAHIARLSAELPEDTTPEAFIAKVQFALSDEESAAIVAERDALKLQVADLTAKVAALSPLAEESAECAKKLAATEAEFSTLKAEYGKITARFGTKPVNTGAKSETPAPTLTRAEFAKLSPADQGAHFKSGGKLTE